MLRVGVLDDYQSVAASMTDWSRLGAGCEVNFLHERTRDPAVLASFDVLVAMRERLPFPADLLRALPRLRLLVATGMHHQMIDFAAAAELGIVVCGTDSSFGFVSTTEHIWALILGLARNVAVEDSVIRAGGWQHSLPTVLTGKTLGIVGLGNLGRSIIPVGKAFGMCVIAWSRNLDPATAAAAGVEYLPHDEFFATSDVITVHLKLGDRSIGYIGAAEFALMKPSAMFVNTSRGPVVDEAALIDALANRRIAGAALDVFDREPLPRDHPLRRLPNTVLSPHLGYVCREAYEVMFTQAVDAVLAFAAGSPIRVLTAKW